MFPESEKSGTMGEMERDWLRSTSGCVKAALVPNCTAGWQGDRTVMQWTGFFSKLEEQRTLALQLGCLYPSLGSSPCSNSWLLTPAMVMARVMGFLSHTQQTWTEFLVPNCPSPAQDVVGTKRGRTAHKSSLYVYFSVSVSISLISRLWS